MSGARTEVRPVRGALRRARARWRPGGSGPVVPQPPELLVVHLAEDAEGVAALEGWWAALPAVERSDVLRLPPGAPLPEDVVVGLVLAGVCAEPRSGPGRRLAQPRLLRDLVRRENARCPGVV